MFQHILMPTDGSQRSEAAVRFGMQLAKAHGARVTALSVADVGGRAHARANLEFVADVAKDCGVACELVAALGDTPHEHIVATAGKLDCDLIVMATHGREGVQAFVLGSQTQKVLAHSKIPVVVCRN
jgi:nucleotide-binding universal stress UspA family protein